METFRETDEPSLVDEEENSTYNEVKAWTRRSHFWSFVSGYPPVTHVATKNI